MTRQKVPIGEKAAIQRINRRLKEDQRKVRTARGERLRQDVGWFYVLDLQRNFIVEKDVDLEALGREVGALQDYETIRFNE
jgi:hypothetical protein